MKLIAPTQIAGIVPKVNVGKAFTVTLPVISAELQPFAFFTVKVNGIELPEAAALKLTVILPFGNVASVTAVMPVPDMV